MTDIAIPTVFTSPTHGQMGWDETLSKIVWFMSLDTNASYDVIIGTDSEASLARDESGRAVNGMGVIDTSTSSVRDASAVVDTGLNLEIHVDIGPNGPTRELIADIVGMIRANGFKVAIKPSSWGASHVADRHV